MRRRLLPTVVPKPRSNGSAKNFPYVDESVDCSAETKLGNSKPRHRIRIIRLRSNYNNCSYVRLFGTKLDYQARLNRYRYIGSLGIAKHVSFGRRSFHSGQEVRNFAVPFRKDRLHQLQALRPVLNANHVAGDASRSWRCPRVLR